MLASLIAGVVLAGVAQVAAPAPAATVNVQWLQYAAPEEIGFSSAKLGEARTLAESIDSAAVMLVVKGNVVVAWGDVERRFECHSVRKSLLSALIGIAVNEGRIDLDATLDELGIDDREPLTAEEKQARVQDLLRARSGVYHPAAKEPADIKAERPKRGSHEPGSFFFYNNWDFNLLGVILARATHKTIGAMFDERIARPLGMQDFRPDDVQDQLEPRQSLHPAYAFRMSARDLARFGLLFVEHGRHEDKSILTKEWIDAAWTAHTSFEQGRGYGYLWWIYPASRLPSHPTVNAHDCFGAVGTGGQLVLCIPSLETVIVHRGDTDNARGVGGGKVWQLVEALLAARTGAAAASPKLEPMKALPFKNPGPPLPQRTAIPLDPDVVAAICGVYEFENKARVEVFEHEHRLFATLSEGFEAELFRSAADEFFLRAANATVTFERDAERRVVAATIEGEIPRRRARRLQ